VNGCDDVTDDFNLIQLQAVIDWQCQYTFLPCGAQYVIRRLQKYFDYMDNRMSMDKNIAL
jgi:hypothetical protein